MAEYTDIFTATTAASIPNAARYLHDGATRNAFVEYTTATYLDVLRLRPSLGRWFDETEERLGAPLVAVLGHQAWTRVFRADPSVVGRVIRIEGVPVTIVGIGPANHRGTVDIGLVTDVWLPITALPAITEIPALRDAPTIYAPLLVKARLREGATVAQAKAAMDVLARRLAAESPDAFRGAGEFAPGQGITVVASKDVRIHPQADAPLMALASLVLVIVGLVLAIACSNLATLLLVRGAARAKEVSVRLAVGATRHQLVRHLLTESLLLSLAGGIAGCVLAWWGIQALQGIDLPVTVDLTLDYSVLAFAIALSLVTGVAFGLAPALKATRVDLLSTLRDEGMAPIDHRRLTLKNALIVFQVAVSVLLLGGTSIFLQMLAATRELRVGYAVDGVAMLETDVRTAGYSAAAARNVYDELLRRIAAVPGVQSAALLRGLPMRSNTVPIVVDGAAGQTGSDVEAANAHRWTGLLRNAAHPAAVRPRVRRTRPRGHASRRGDHRDHGATILWRGGPGRPSFPDRQTDPSSWMEVIGVVRDTGTGNFGDDVLDPIPPPFYSSYTQSDALPTTIIARTSGDAAALVGAMQRELRALDVTLPVMTAKTMAQDLEESQTAPKAVATFLGVLGGLGLVLASIGLYAVVAFAVARRSREIGIRMALGARSRAGDLEHCARSGGADRGRHGHRSRPLGACDAGAARGVTAGDRARKHRGVSPQRRPGGAAGYRRRDRSRRPCRCIRARAPGRPNGSARGTAPRVTPRPVRRDTARSRRGDAPTRMDRAAAARRVPRHRDCQHLGSTYSLWTRKKARTFDERQLFHERRYDADPVPAHMAVSIGLTTSSVTFGSKPSVCPLSRRIT